MSQTISKFTVQGMHCPACQKVIQKKLATLPDVQVQKLEQTGELEMIGTRAVGVDEIQKALDGLQYTVSM